MLLPYFEKVSITQLQHCTLDPDMDLMRENPRFQEMVGMAVARLGVSRSALPGEGRLLASEAAAQMKAA
jgi:hypothetical protein